MARSLFLQTISASGLVESRDGGPPRVISRAYMVQGGALVSIRDALGVCLKWSARAVYVSPLLVVARLVVHAFDRENGEILVAAFVGIVVLFFVVLCLYLVAAFIAWKQSMRVSLSRVTHVGPTEMAGATDADAQDVGRMVTVTGRAVRLSAGDEPLIADFWRGPTRTTEASVFGLLRKDGAPVIVFATTAPTVIANATELTAALALSKTALAKSELLDTHEGSALAIRAGDEITVTGQLLDRIPNITEFELDGEMYRFDLQEKEGEESPYRMTTIAGGLLISDTQAPMTIAITPSRRA